MSANVLPFTSASQRRRSWALDLMGRADGPTPAYGSPEWLALPDGPQKVASVVRAAEAWALDGDHLEERLRLELDVAREVTAKLEEDAAFVAGGEAHRARWEPIAEVIGRRAGGRYPRRQA